MIVPEPKPVEWGPTTLIRTTVCAGWGLANAVAVGPSPCRDSSESSSRSRGRSRSARRTGRAGVSASASASPSSSRGTAWALAWAGGWALALAAR